MAFKDTFNKMISYFDTDEVNEVEEDVAASTDNVIPRSQQSVRASSHPKQEPRNNQVQQYHQARPQEQTRSQMHPKHGTSERYYQQSQPKEGHEMVDRRKRMSTSGIANRREQYQQSTCSDQTTIALKYPRKYEDAQEIVDLLIVNECVLIDFQFMLDAQARRCLDFIDGASKVLYGSLQKVGSSMYLLAPSNVSVNIEEMTIPHTTQDIGFDFDMKRR
ncbi:TPA: cell division protein SepF [Streptococcus pyogenes]